LKGAPGTNPVQGGSPARSVAVRVENRDSRRDPGRRGSGNKGGPSGREEIRIYIMSGNKWLVECDNESVEVTGQFCF